ACAAAVPLAGRGQLASRTSYCYRTVHDIVHRTRDEWRDGMGEIPAIETERLTKSFGSTQALSGLDLTVPQGGILGLLGPNGAGKTTAVRVLATLLRPDSGHARVLGAARLPDGARQSGHDRPAEPAQPGGGPAPGRRSARPLRPHARGRARRQDVFRRHAPPPRPGRQPDRPSRGALPG